MPRLANGKRVSYDCEYSDGCDGCTYKSCEHSCHYEWGIRRPDLASGFFACGNGKEAEELARSMASGQNPAIVRKVTYTPWEEVAP